jgi:hypothetical protein
MSDDSDDSDDVKALLIHAKIAKLYPDHARRENAAASFYRVEEVLAKMDGMDEAGVEAAYQRMLRFPASATFGERKLVAAFVDRVRDARRAKAITKPS